MSAAAEGASPYFRGGGGNASPLASVHMFVVADGSGGFVEGGTAVAGAGGMERGGPRHGGGGGGGGDDDLAAVIASWSRI